jgi:hypothetical protein
MKTQVPIQVAHLFKPLDEKLMELLASLSDADWQKPTVARHWKVKDVVSHLLDGNLRTLSIQRDRYFGDTPPAIQGYSDLVNWLNALNADWTRATRRISPQVLVLLHRLTGPLVSQYYESLNLLEPALFPVAWAGETESLNWMHLAREYTEKWHHQQQIREIIGNEELMSRRYFYPVMDTFFRALPFIFQAIPAPEGTVIQVWVTTDGGGEWLLEKQKEGWRLVDQASNQAMSRVEIPAAIAWKLFSKNIRPSEILEQVRIAGDAALGRHVLEMVSVMA